MTAVGVFRDDFYNAASVLTVAQQTALTANGGTIPASALAGADECYVAFSGQTTAQAWTTDSAANIVAALQNAVATAYKAQLASLGAGVNPAVGVPNLFNLTWLVNLTNNNTASGAITISNGAGVTFVGSNTIAITTTVEYMLQVTSPTTVTITRLASKGV